MGCLQISFLPGLSRRGMLRGQIESVRIAARAAIPALISPHSNHLLPATAAKGL